MRKSLAMKLMIVTGLIVLSVLFISNIVLVWGTEARLDSLVRDRATAEAGSVAANLTSCLNELAGQAKAMAGMIEVGHAEAKNDRSAVISMTKAPALHTDQIYGSWFVAEPNGYDGRDAEFAGKSSLEGNSKGIFAAYWAKKRDGKLEYITPDIDYASDYYAAPKQGKHGVITKPYVERSSDVPTTMTSIAYPVVSKDKVIGVAGVDIALESIGAYVSQLRPFETGRVMLLSQDKQWLAGPSKEDAMTEYAGSGAEAVDAALRNGTVSYLDGFDIGGSSVTRLIYPFDLAGLGARWAIIVDIPSSVITKPVSEQTQVMIASGVFVLLAVMVGLFFAVRYLLQKPIAAIVAQVDDMGRGNYGAAVAGQDRADELGNVNRALEQFRNRLAAGVELEKTSQRQRADAEADRIETDNERAGAAERQKRVVASLARGLSQLSDGDLSFRIVEDLPGEYAQIKIDFNGAVESLEQTIRGLMLSVNAIGGGASEISSAADDLSQRTERQAASLEQTAAALDQITSQVNLSAKNARSAAEAVSIASADSESSGKVVNQAVSSMRLIEQSSQEMERIISVIDQIAFQTNLLALNAGVEAARAGEAGRGFAVVAQEVRELAQRSANAAKQVTALINSSAEQVKDGVGLVHQAGESITKIAEQIRRINGLTAEISASATEQATGLREINTAVNQMDQVTQQNAAMVEQTSASSASLNDEAAALRSLVTKFRLSAVANDIYIEPSRPRLVVG